MTLININRKGGDAHGKVPKRIAIAPAAFLKIRGAGGVYERIRKGEQENAWPGQKDLLPYVLALEGRGLR
jgi:hypothetical protein